MWKIYTCGNTSNISIRASWLLTIKSHQCATEQTVAIGTSNKEVWENESSGRGGGCNEVALKVMFVLTPEALLQYI